MRGHCHERSFFRQIYSCRLWVFVADRTKRLASSVIRRVLLELGWRSAQPSIAARIQRLAGGFIKAAIVGTCGNDSSPPSYIFIPDLTGGKTALPKSSRNLQTLIGLPQQGPALTRKGHQGALPGRFFKCKRVLMITSQLYKQRYKKNNVDYLHLYIYFLETLDVQNTPLRYKIILTVYDAYAIVRTSFYTHKHKAKNYLNNSIPQPTHCFDGQSVTTHSTPIMTCSKQDTHLSYWMMALPMLRQMACSDVLSTGIFDLLAVYDSEKAGDAEEQYAYRSYAPSGAVSTTARSGRWFKLTTQIFIQECLLYLEHIHLSLGLVLIS